MESIRMHPDAGVMLHCDPCRALEVAHYYYFLLISFVWIGCFLVEWKALVRHSPDTIMSIKFESQG